MGGRSGVLHFAIIIYMLMNSRTGCLGPSFPDVQAAAILACASGAEAILCHQCPHPFLLIQLAQAAAAILGSASGAEASDKTK